MASDTESGRPSRPVRPTVRALVTMARHEVRGIGLRLLGRDSGLTLLPATPLTDAGMRLREAAARIVVEARSWAEAVETVRSRWDGRTRRRASTMLSHEDFDDFVVFSVRATNEVLRQSLDGPVIDRSDLKAGLEYEARLNRMSPTDVFAEAVRLAPELGPTSASSPTPRTWSDVHAAVEPALRGYARVHGPLPARLLDATVQHLLEDS
jgi:hypothetical protein